MKIQNSNKNNSIEILVVEDSPTQLELLKRLLEKYGYVVASAANGREALAQVRQHPPTLVVSDILMPEMDGYRLCKEMKSDKKLKDIPVILLTSLSSPQDVIQGLECGANSFIRKPFDEKYLLSRISYTLTNQELRKSEKMQFGIEMILAGQKHFITAERSQVLDLLISTYDQAVQINNELEVKQRELEGAYQNLEKLVEERTAALRQEITERKKTEEALRLSEEQLRQAQKMDAIGRLAGGVAHDFNNILTAILGYSELLLEHLAPNDPMRRQIEEIRAAAERAATLTRQLLIFSRKQELTVEVLDINAGITNIETLLRRLIGEDIELVTHLKTEDGCIQADASQLEQVLMNLVVNARDAMPHGGTLTIETANVDLASDYPGLLPDNKPGGPYVMLSVSDTGVGMSKEVQSHLFEPFFTTKEKGKGTGLGLSTVYGIVKQNGGLISVCSEPGKGSTFKVYFPRIKEKAPAEEKKVPLQPAAKRPAAPETVLLVEDEEILSELAQDILQMKGYRVLAAHDGEEAIRLCQEHKGPIHLLLTDLILPKMSGRDLQERIASMQPETKVLYMSGYTEAALTQQGVLDPGTAFISKPFTPSSLLHKVREVLETPRRAA